MIFYVIYQMSLFNMSIKVTTIVPECDIWWRVYFWIISIATVMVASFKIVNTSSPKIIVYQVRGGNSRYTITCEYRFILNRFRRNFFSYNLFEQLPSLSTSHIDMKYNLFGDLLSQHLSRALEWFEIPFIELIIVSSVVWCLVY